MPETETEIPLEYNSPNSSLSSSLSSLNFNNNQAQPQQQQLQLQREPQSRSSSSSLDLPNNDEEFYPQQPYLFPVIVPPMPQEQTLDELLRNVTGRNDIMHVEAIKLRVISLTVSLHRLSYFMPNLASLNLDGSVLSSLRDLGSGLTHLTFLNVSNCGLTSLDGTNGVTNLRTLIADHNMIQLIGSVQNLRLLKKLSLRSNQINDENYLIYLGICDLLEEVDFRGNPITNEQLYLQQLRQTLPLLGYIDGENVVATSDDDNHQRPHGRNNKRRSTRSSSRSSSDASENLDSCASTLSDEAFSIVSESHEEVSNTILKSLNKRPSTSQSAQQRRRHVYFKDQVNDDIERPSTADPIKSSTLQTSYRPSQFEQRRFSLTSGDAVCGSIIGSIRKQRKVYTTAWGSRTLSTASTSSSSSSADSPETFQITRQRICQKKSAQVSSENENSIASDLDPEYNNCNSSGSSSSACDDVNSSLKNNVTKWRAECQREISITKDEN